MIGLLSSVTNLATTFIDSKAKIKQAEAETKMKLATGEISWEQSAIEASKDTGKTVWTVCFYLNCCGGTLCPGIQPFMQQGFENMENLRPPGLQWAVYASMLGGQLRNSRNKRIWQMSEALKKLQERCEGLVADGEFGYLIQQGVLPNILI